MTTNPNQPGANIKIASLPNLRDLGGWATSDGGHVRYGQLYRTVETGKITDADMPKVDALALRTIYDLRTKAERDSVPDRLPSGAKDVVCDVLADAPGASAAQLEAVVSKPKAAEEMLGGGKGAAAMEKSYREEVSLSCALDAYRKFFTGIAEAAARPALFHCTTGKDRTGWASAATMMLLGVSDADVKREYLLTNDQLLPELQPVFDKFKSEGGDPDLLRPVLGVEPEYLAAAIDEMHKKYGTIEEYFADGLGIDADGQSSLRDALIDHS